MGILLYATGTGAAERTLTLLRYSTSHENRRYVDTVVFGSVCMWRARVHWMRSSRLPCSRLLATLERSPCCSALEQRPAQDLMLSCHLVIIVSSAGGHASVERRSALASSMAPDSSCVHGSSIHACDALRH